MTKQQALELAIKMLNHIRDGKTYGMIEFHEKLIVLEKTRDAS